MLEFLVRFFQPRVIEVALSVLTLFVDTDTVRLVAEILRQMSERSFDL